MQCLPNKKSSQGRELHVTSTMLPQPACMFNEYWKRSVNDVTIRQSAESLIELTVQGSTATQFTQGDGKTVTSTLPLVSSSASWYREGAKKRPGLDKPSGRIVGIPAPGQADNRLTEQRCRTGLNTRKFAERCEEGNLRNRPTNEKMLEDTKAPSVQDQRLGNGLPPDVTVSKAYYNRWARKPSSGARKPIPGFLGFHRMITSNCLPTKRSPDDSAQLAPAEISQKRQEITSSCCQTHIPPLPKITVNMVDSQGNSRTASGHSEDDGSDLEYSTPSIYSIELDEGYFASSLLSVPKLDLMDKAQRWSAVSMTDLKNWSDSSTKVESDGQSDSVGSERVWVSNPKVIGPCDGTDTCITCTCTVHSGISELNSECNVELSTMSCQSEHGSVDQSSALSQVRPCAKGGIVRYKTTDNVSSTTEDGAGDSYRSGHGRVEEKPVTIDICANMPSISPISRTLTLPTPLNSLSISGIDLLCRSTSEVPCKPRSSKTEDQFVQSALRFDDNSGLAVEIHANSLTTKDNQKNCVLKTPHSRPRFTSEVLNITTEKSHTFKPIALRGKRLCSPSVSKTLGEVGDLQPALEDNMPWVLNNTLKSATKKPAAADPCEAAEIHSSEKELSRQLILVGLSAIQGKNSSYSRASKNVKKHLSSFDKNFKALVSQFHRRAKTFNALRRSYSSTAKSLVQSGPKSRQCQLAELYASDFPVSSPSFPRDEFVQFAASSRLHDRFSYKHNGCDS